MTLILDILLFGGFTEESNFFSCKINMTKNNHNIKEKTVCLENDSQAADYWCLYELTLSNCLFFGC